MKSAFRSLLGVVGAGLLGALALGTTTALATPPPIRTSEANKVPDCVTPERLMQFLATRNSHLRPEFSKIAELYKKHGEALGVRWDYAFYQMAIETNFLTYRTGGGGWGDVNPKQYNFAGIGTTGGGVPGDAFPDASAGVLAQIQHLVVYSGERVANPTARRTREKQDDILAWTAKLAERRPVTFSDLAGRWAVDRRYARSIETIADRFRASFCNGRSEQAQASDGKSSETASADDEDETTARKGRRGKRSRTSDKGKDKIVKVSGRKRGQSDDDDEDDSDKSRKASHGKSKGKSHGTSRDNDDEDDVAKAKSDDDDDNDKSVQVLNGGKSTILPKDEAKAPALADARTVDEKIDTMKQAPEGPALRSGLGLGLLAGGTIAEPAAAAGTCKVWTASYGGNRAVIIKALLDNQMAFTVLGVTEANARKEVDAYIAAYAKGGQTIGEFKTEDAALAKAFELCPKG